MDDEIIVTTSSRIAPMSRGDVTLLLAGTGAVAGFVLGTATLAILQIWAPGGFHWGIDIPFGMMFGGTFGAFVGGIGAPILAWAFMRTVPLGRAIGWSAVATVAGALGGLLAGHPALGGCLGFGLGAIALWATHRSPTA
jgi:hypothetical protein